MKLANGAAERPVDWRDVIADPDESGGITVAPLWFSTRESAQMTVGAVRRAAPRHVHPEPASEH